MKIKKDGEGIYVVTQEGIPVETGRSLTVMVNGSSCRTPIGPVDGVSFRR